MNGNGKFSIDRRITIGEIVTAISALLAALAIMVAVQSHIGNREIHLTPMQHSAYFVSRAEYDLTIKYLQRSLEEMKSDIKDIKKKVNN